MSKVLGANVDFEVSGLDLWSDMTVAVIIPRDYMLPVLLSLRKTEEQIYKCHAIAVRVPKSFPLTCTIVLVHK